MDIGNIQSTGGIDRTGDRLSRPGASKVDAGARKPGQDSATISAAGRETLEATEALVEKARAGEDRTAIVEQAKARLASGDLASPEALEGAARGLLDEGF